MDFQIHSQQIIKENHLNLVFSLIHQLDCVSRADIKKLTKLSATTVSALVEELIQRGIVVESGIKNATTSGRKGISLSVNNRGGYFAVVTASAHHFRLRIFDLCFDEISSLRVRYDNSLPLSQTLCDFLTENVYIKDFGQLLGITIGIPAIIDSQNNIVSSTVLNISGGDNVYKTICDKFENVKIIFCNNSSLLAYAEKEFGETDAENLISIDISDGVGASAIIGGMPFSGSAGMALEFGHVTVDIDGKECACGSRGCLETLVSVPAILEKASEICGFEMDIESLAGYIAKNDELSRYINYIASVLAYGINNLLNIFDPEAVVLCGDILLLGDDFVKLIREKLERIALPGRTVSFTASTLGDNVEFKGGAKYLFDSLFK